MDTHNGPWLIAFLCCGWPLIIHFAIIAAPHIWRWIGRHIPEKQ